MASMLQGLTPHQGLTVHLQGRSALHQDHTVHLLAEAASMAAEAEAAVTADVKHLPGTIKFSIPN